MHRDYWKAILLSAGLIFVVLGGPFIILEMWPVEKRTYTIDGTLELYNGDYVITLVNTSGGSLHRFDYILKDPEDNVVIKERLDEIYALDQNFLDEDLVATDVQMTYHNNHDHFSMRDNDMIHIRSRENGGIADVNYTLILHDFLYGPSDILEIKLTRNANSSALPNNFFNRSRYFQLENVTTNGTNLTISTTQATFSRYSWVSGLDIDIGLTIENSSPNYYDNVTVEILEMWDNGDEIRHILIKNLSLSIDANSYERVLLVYRHGFYNIGMNFIQVIITQNNHHVLNATASIDILGDLSG